MKKIIAVVIVAVLLLIVLGQYAPQDTMQQLPNLPNFQLEQVADFNIQVNGQSRVQGKRDGDYWLLATDPTVHLQTTVVGQLLHDLQSMSVKRVASNNKEQQTRFAVNEAQVILKNGQGKVLLDVFVGKPATDLRSTYIRLAQQDSVLTVDKVLTWQVKRTADAWLEKEVVPEQL